MQRLTALVPVLSILNNRFTSVLRSTAAFAALLGVVVGTMLQATAQLRAMGNAIGDLRSASGMSAGASGRLIGAYNAQGMRPGDSSALFGGMNLMEQRARAGIFGASSFADIPTIARNYQRMDPMARSASLGILDTPEMRRILSTPSGMLNRQSAFNGRVQGGLGVNPAEIERTSRELALVTDRFRILRESALVKLGSVALPRLITILDNVTNRMAGRSDALGTAIENGVNKAFSALIRVGEFILDLPPMLFAITDSLLGFASAAVSALPVVWSTFLQGVDSTQQALESLWSSATNGFQRLMGVVAAVSNGFIAMVNIAETAWTQIQTPIGSVFNSIIKFMNDLAASPLLSKLSAYMQAQDTKRQVTDPIARQASKWGASPGWAQIIGDYAPGALVMGGIGLAGRLGGRLLGLGGLGAGAGSGAGAATPGLLARLGMAGGALMGPLAGAGATAIAGTTAAFGAAGGYLGYKYFQKTQRDYGWNQGKGFWETMGHGTGVISDFLTGNNGNTQRNYDKALAARAAQSAVPSITGGGGGYGPQIPSLSWAKGLQNMPGMLGGMAQNAWGNFAEAPRGTWASGLDKKFTGGVQEQSARAASAINGLRADLQKQMQAYDPEAQKKILRELEKQTPLLQESAENTKSLQSSDRAAGYALWRFSREQGAANRRVGN